MWYNVNRKGKQPYKIARRRNHAKPSGRKDEDIMKNTLYAISTNADEMVVSAYDDGTIYYISDGELYGDDEEGKSYQIDLHDLFRTSEGGYDAEKAEAWLRTVEDDSSWHVMRPEDDDYIDIDEWLHEDGIEIVAKIEAEY